MRPMHEWEVLMIERECEVGQVSINDITTAMGEALDQGGLTDEEWGRMKSAMERIAGENREAIREGMARMSKALARHEVGRILKEGWR